MEAKNNGTKNPFADTVHSLEWITSAMDAARRYKERLQDPVAAGNRVDEHRRTPGEAT
ncbi:MAG TPA: hypothetical protein VF339_07660 [Gammaproteobacteria bacterium]